MIYNLFLFIGKHADKTMPLGLLIGLLLPSAAAFCFELLFYTMCIPLTISLARIDWKDQLNYLKRWHFILAIIIWMMVVCPILIWALSKFLPLNEKLLTAMILTAAAPPVTACAALAFILRTDAALVTVLTFISMALTPFIMPFMSFWLAGFELEISMIDFMGRLALFVGISFLGAYIIKHFVEPKTLQDNAHMLDGVSAICITLSIIGLMHGSYSLLMTDPTFVFVALIYSSSFVIGLNLISSFIFGRFEIRQALAIGLVSGHCNMGQVYMIIGDHADPKILIFFALGQIPMYISPIFFRMFYRHAFQFKYS